MLKVYVNFPKKLHNIDGKIVRDETLPDYVYSTIISNNVIVSSLFSFLFLIFYTTKHKKVYVKYLNPPFKLP